jgi:hypothetical protein
MSDAKAKAVQAARLRRRVAANLLYALWAVLVLFILTLTVVFAGIGIVFTTAVILDPASALGPFAGAHNAMVGLPGWALALLTSPLDVVGAVGICLAGAVLLLMHNPVIELLNFGKRFRQPKQAPS